MDRTYIPVLVPVTAVLILLTLYYGFGRQWHRDSVQRRVLALYIYPVKSCKGISVDNWPLTKYGLKYDRWWMVVRDNPEKTFITQREEPRLILITPEINEDPTHPHGDSLILNAPGMETLLVPLTLNEEIRSHPVYASEWSDTVAAFDVGPEAANWFTRFLGYPVRLITKDDTQVRPVLANAPSPDEVGFMPETAFADVHPILLTTISSLKHLQSLLPDPTRNLQIEQFRPNVHVWTVTPYEEESWKRITLNDIPMFVASRSPRCRIPTVNMLTGKFSPDGEPQKTIQKFRRVDKGAKAFGCFGMNVVPGVQGGVNLSVGDKVRIITKGEHMRTS